MYSVLGGSHWAGPTSGLPCSAFLTPLYHTLSSPNKEHKLSRWTFLVQQIPGNHCGGGICSPLQKCLSYYSGNGHSGGSKRITIWISNFTGKSITQVGGRQYSVYSPQQKDHGAQPEQWTKTTTAPLRARDSSKGTYGYFT